jgi:tetratricopeptide (TPR) repeat protein
MKKESSDTDEAFKEADFGDKAWLFFQKNSALLSVTSAVIIAIALIFCIGKLWVNGRNSRIQAAYARIDRREGMVNFIKKYRGHRLVGIVSLALGDEYVDEGDYGRAIAAYETAEKLLKSTILLPRVQIGKAEAMYRSGNCDGSEKLLESIIHNRNFDRAYRGSAAYALALMLDDSDNPGKLALLAGEVDGLDLTPGAAAMIKEMTAKN